MGAPQESGRDHERLRPQFDRFGGPVTRDGDGPFDVIGSWGHLETPHHGPRQELDPTGFSKDIPGKVRGILRSDRTGREAGIVAAKVNRDVNQAVISLQFEDMVYQLMMHIELRIGIFEQETSVLKMLGKYQDSSIDTRCDKIEHLKKIRENIQAVNKRTYHKSVTQKNMSSGEIDLF